MCKQQFVSATAPARVKLPRLYTPCDTYPFFVVDCHPCSRGVRALLARATPHEHQTHTTMYADEYGYEPEEPQEAIYNWIKEEVRVPPKPKRYRSKHNPKAGVTGSTLRVNKKAAGTFGRPSQRSQPTNYLKAGSKMGKGTTTMRKRTSCARVCVCVCVCCVAFESVGRCCGRAMLPAQLAHHPVVRAAKQFRRTAAAPRKSAVPRRDERPVYGLKTSKNFVVSNAVENILAGPFRGVCWLDALRSHLSVPPSPLTQLPRWWTTAVWTTPRSRTTARCPPTCTR